MAIRKPSYHSPHRTVSDRFYLNGSALSESSCDDLIDLRLVDLSLIHI